MHIANYVAHKLDLIDKKDYDYLQGLIEFNLPSFSVDQVDSYMELLKKDKKNTTGVITCVLPHGRGDMRVTPILDLKELKIILEHYFFWN
jgi:3-dehydroquinate synthetase